MYSTKLVTDITQLSVPTTKVDVNEGLKIGQHLIEQLQFHNDGIGLAANQLGIDASVCIIDSSQLGKSSEPLILVNPVILDKSGSVMFAESCLSFPGQVVKTIRASSITVQADNHESILVFGPDSDFPTSMDMGLMESIVVQHEIGHLNGETMWDYQQKPMKRESRKYGRNCRVTIRKGTETQVLKYKKCEAFLADGWETVND